MNASIAITYAGLAVASVIALAAFLQAATTCWFSRRWEETKTGNLLPSLALQHDENQQRRLLDTYGKRRDSAALPLLAAARRILDNELNWPVIQGDLDRFVLNLDRGAIRWLTVIVKVSPLLGLAGTLVGVSQGLADYAADPTSTTQIVGAFAFAFTTTLWGIGIAVAGIVASRLIWQPYLERVHETVQRQALDLLSRRVPSKEGSKAHATVRKPKRRRRRSDESDRPDGHVGGGTDAVTADVAQSIDELVAVAGGGIFQFPVDLGG